MKESILVINPGSTSTKITIFDGDTEVWKTIIRHNRDELQEFSRIIDQLDYRFGRISDSIPEELSNNWIAVVGRGGLMQPCEGGTYYINNIMLRDVAESNWGEHASNLGCMLADRFAAMAGVQAFIVDPVTTDEFEDVSRISGVPGIERKSRAHALNIKATARKAAGELEISFELSRFVVAHMGGGISIAALKDGRISDVNDAILGMGPFSPERAGALPLAGVIDLVESEGKQRAIEIFSHESGFAGYFNTSSLEDIETMIAEGDKQAELIWEAMIYQVAKEIGAMAASLNGIIDGIILTGGLVNSKKFMKRLVEKVSFLGQIFVYPGEEEMKALAEGALRVFRGEESAKHYGESK